MKTSFSEEIQYYHFNSINQITFYKLFKMFNCDQTYYKSLINKDSRTIQLISNFFFDYLK